MVRLMHNIRNLNFKTFSTLLGRAGGVGGTLVTAIFTLSSGESANENMAGEFRAGEVSPFQSPSSGVQGVLEGERQTAIFYKTQRAEGS